MKQTDYDVKGLWQFRRKTIKTCVRLTAAHIENISVNQISVKKSLRTLKLGLCDADFIHLQAVP